MARRPNFWNNLAISSRASVTRWSGKKSRFPYMTARQGALSVAPFIDFMAERICVCVGDASGFCARIDNGNFLKSFGAFTMTDLVEMEYKRTLHDLDLCMCMSPNRAPLAGHAGWVGMLACLCLVVQAAADSPAPGERDVVVFTRGGFSVETNNNPAAVRLRLLQELRDRQPAFSQSAIKQGTAVARLGPDPAVPYF